MKLVTIIVRTTIASALCLGALTGVAQAQYLTIKYSAGDDAQGNVTYVGTSAVRIKADVYDVIDRMDRGTLVYLNHNRKTYKELTAADVKASFAQQQQKMEMRMNDPQLKEEMQRRGRSATTTLTKLGPGGTVAGYPTEKYLLKGPMMEAELWITQSLQFPDAFYRDFNVLNGASAPFGSWDKVMDLRGVILKRVVNLSAGAMKISETATSVDKSAIPPTTFEVPAGYTKVRPR